MIKMNRIWSKFLMSYVVVILLVVLIWDGSSTVFIRDHLVKENVQQLQIVADKLREQLETRDIDQLSLKKLAHEYGCNIFVMTSEGYCRLSSVDIKRENVTVSEQVISSVDRGEDVYWEWSESPTNRPEIALATPSSPNSGSS